MTQEDPDLRAARQSIESAYGKCLLMLQTYELRLKAIIGSSEFSGPETDLQDAIVRRRQKVRGKTMGTLVGDLLEDFLVRDGQQDMSDLPDDPKAEAFVNCKYQIGLPEEELARITQKHRDLVQQRNTLVHHFLETHDLWTMEGCRAADRALAKTRADVTVASEDLRQWTKDLDILRTRLAEALSSDEVRDAIVTGNIPWHMAPITHALQDAATALGLGEWVLLHNAIDWIAKHRPDETPQAYKCQSWQQVIHMSKLFDLDVRKVEGHRERWYRPRPSANSQGHH